MDRTPPTRSRQMYICGPERDIDTADHVWKERMIFNACEMKSRK